jgi:hypothetical protein
MVTTNYESDNIKNQCMPCTDDHHQGQTMVVMVATKLKTRHGDVNTYYDL